MSLLKFRAGIDAQQQPLAPAEAATLLRDPFAQAALLNPRLGPSQWPQSLKAVADLFPDIGPSAGSSLVFLAGDGGHVSKPPHGMHACGLPL